MTATKNVIPVTPQTRTPRGIIKIDGTAVSGWTELSWDNNTFFEADTFRATFAVSSLPSDYDVDYFSDTVDMPVEIFAGFPANASSYSSADLSSMISGVVDTVDWSIGQGSITISGRDLTAKLIQSKTDAKYANQTASQIVTSIANDIGLTPKVTATTVLAGHYYEIDHVRLQDNRTLWDLVCYLARQEGMVAYVSGKELHFEAPPDLSGTPYEFYYVPPAEAGGPARGNFADLHMERALTVAKDIVVKVRSWNSRTKTAFTMIAKAAHTKSSGDSQTYIFNIPGLTSAQAQKRAEELALELSKHERKATISGHADNILLRTDVVSLTGTDTAFDQNYFIESISRSLSYQGGYEWTVNLKNHSPETTTSL